ncbi:unnamed protein product, partial [Sphacelaria rigidula]
AYAHFLEDLREYLASFLKRTQPLVDLDEVLSTTDDDFEEAWKAGTLPGWSRARAMGAAAGSTPRPLDLKRY